MTEPALDSETVAELLESTGGDREFLVELFGTFADEAPALMQTIELSVASGDFTALRGAAHTLKSTSASLGALTLSAVSRELEEAGRSATSPDLASVAHARTLLTQALNEMSNFEAENGS